MFCIIRESTQFEIALRKLGTPKMRMNVYNLPYIQYIVMSTVEPRLPGHQNYGHLNVPGSYCTKRNYCVALLRRRTCLKPLYFEL